ncbi:septum formation family protein [Dactylosporangium sp. NBC_01737]|uniref:septum formation family protein n=1 Tax=Dactylosporangium sp. NBC_01737 TaxID=2975959 RepID=UPI002E11957A|nr:septum formation family protein [Dactylosporangium sp. NBC_01737]
MRRAVVLVVAAVTLLGGCARPPAPAATDGDLVNGWPMLPAATLIEPVAPACYPLPGGTASADVTSWPAPVACTAPHEVELISVGRFTGADAERATPPSAGGPAMRGAYTRCADDAKTLLGADWRSGRISLSVDVPSPLLWDAGARWFRCDLQALQDIDRFSIASRTTSLRGALSPDGGELRIGCVKVTTKPGGAANAIDRIFPAPCTQPHEGEFAGIYEPPAGEYIADGDARSSANLAGCRPVVAGFVAVPDDANFRSRTGLVTMPYDKMAWELGNRGVRCFVWPPKPVHASLRGAGTKGLPITIA